MKKVFAIILLGVLGFSACKKDETSPVQSVVTSGYDGADAIAGGILYDKFWSSEAKYDVSDTTKLNHLNANADFYRCKQCHAWDLMGNTGSYISRSPKNNRPNVAGSLIASKSKTPQQLFDAIKIGSVTRRTTSADLASYNPSSNSTVGDQMPNYSTLLTDVQIWNIVKFIKEGATDVTLLYDATYSGTYPTGSAKYSNIGKDGNATNGNTFYNINCASCHGADGKSIPDLDHTAGLGVGKFVRTKPNEVQHKIKYGTLGSAMLSNPTVTLANLKDVYKALTDTTTFPN